MLSTLALKRATSAQGGKGGYYETRQGQFVFGGNAREFHEWEFRTTAKHMGCSDDKERSALAGKVLEGLVRRREAEALLYQGAIWEHV